MHDADAWKQMKALGALAPLVLPAEVVGAAWKRAERAGRLERWGQLSKPAGLKPGACRALFVLTGASKSRGIAIPLIWRNGDRDQDGLPDGLLGLAENIRAALAQRNKAEPSVVPNVPGLWLDTPRPEDDLVALRKYLQCVTGDGENKQELRDGCWPAAVSCDSAFAPLAAALWLLQHGGTPRAEVWATGAWDRDNGIVEVDGIAEKLGRVAEVATALGSKQIVFVPKECEAKASAAANGAAKIEVQALKAAPHDAQRSEGDLVLEALRPLLMAMHCEPGTGAPAEEKFKHFRMLVEMGARHDDYYSREVIPAEAARLRGELKGRGFDWLVMWKDRNNLPLGELLEAIVRPQKGCIPLTDTDDRAVMETKQGMADFVLAQIQRKVQPGDTCAIDLTTGKKLMTVAAEQLPLSGVTIYIDNGGKPIQPPVGRPVPDPLRKSLVVWEK